MESFKKILTEDPTKITLTVSEKWVNCRSERVINEVLKDTIWLFVVLQAEKMQRRAMRKPLYSLIKPSILVSNSHCDNTALHEACNRKIRIKFDASEMMITMSISPDANGSEQRIYGKSIRQMIEMLRHEII